MIEKDIYNPPGSTSGGFIPILPDDDTESDGTEQESEN